MKKDIEKGRLGSTFDSFLDEQDIREETSEIAAKRVIAWQLAEIMKEQHITKVEMARRLDTSRAQLDRVLNPEDGNITLETLQRAAKAVGRSIRLELV